MRGALEQTILNGLYKQQTKVVYRTLKFNPNHDELGRFSSGPGGARQKQIFASLNDAGDWATANVTRKFKVYSDNGEKIAIVMTEQISDISKPFPLKKPFTDIRVFPQKNSDGSYSPNKHDLWIDDKLPTGRLTFKNGSQYPNIDKIQRTPFDNIEHWTIASTLDNYAKGVVTHEWGHAVVESNKKKVLDAFGSKSLDDKANKDLAKTYAVSRYSGANFNECLAENFEAYVHGGKHLMHPDMVRFFDSIKKG